MSDQIPDAVEAVRRLGESVLEAGAEAGSALSAVWSGAFRSLRHGIRHAREEQERRLAQQFLDRSRRARLAAFEASDPAGRLAEMTSRHSAEARRLAADYGFEDPAVSGPRRRRFATWSGVAASMIPVEALLADFYGEEAVR